MRLGLYTVLFPEMELDELVGTARRLGISSFELSSKPKRGLRHFDPEEILESESAFSRFTDTLRRNDITISQINGSCNPVSPVPGEAEQCRKNFELTFRLAEKLGVDTVGSFSGCPGGGPGEETPNWITCPWPTQFSEMLAWQWEERLIPFWSWASKRAAEFGVTKIALEMHPGFCVYNPETLLKLRRAVGDSIGANLDPSHFVWQGIDIPAAIGALRGAIWHFHAKDSFVDRRNVAVNGCIDTKHYSELADRAWTFRTVGYGMTAETWRGIISALRLAGYDGALSIEHEDVLMSRMEGLAKAAAFLKDVMFEERADSMWWA